MFDLLTLIMQRLQTKKGDTAMTTPADGTAAAAALDPNTAPAAPAAEQRGAGTGEEAIAARDRSYDDPATANVVPTAEQRAQIEKQSAE